MKETKLCLLPPINMLYRELKRYWRMRAISRDVSTLVTTHILVRRRVGALDRKDHLSGGESHHHAAEARRVEGAARVRRPRVEEILQHGRPRESHQRPVRGRHRPHSPRRRQSHRLVLGSFYARVEGRAFCYNNRVKQSSRHGLSQLR